MYRYLDTSIPTMRSSLQPELEKRGFTLQSLLRVANSERNDNDKRFATSIPTTKGQYYDRPYKKWQVHFNPYYEGLMNSGF